MLNRRMAYTEHLFDNQSFSFWGVFIQCSSVINLRSIYVHCHNTFSYVTCMINSKSSCSCRVWNQHISHKFGDTVAIKYVPWVTSVIPLEENDEQFCEAMLDAFSQCDPVMSVLEVLMNLLMNRTTCDSGVKHVWVPNVR
jgi:hypothetical protein